MVREDLREFGTQGEREGDSLEEGDCETLSICTDSPKWKGYSRVRRGHRVSDHRTNAEATVTSNPAAT